MAKEISDIRNEIYNFAENYGVFKNNSFIDACFKLTCAMEHYYLSLMTEQCVQMIKCPETFMMGRLPFIMAQNAQGNIRHSYREALKHAYRFCKERGDEPELHISSAELEGTLNELLNFGNFNQVRNLFEQSDLKRYTVSVRGENEISFERNKSKRSIDAALYERWVDNEKPELRDRQLKQSVEMELYNNMVNPYNCVFWDVEDKSFSNLTHLKDVYKLALKKFDVDNEEDGNYDFGPFTTEQFKNVYAALTAISVTNGNYHFSSRMMSGIENDKSALKKMPGCMEIDKNAPIAVFELNKLINIIRSLTNLSKETICAVIEKLSYDAEFHKDKITVFQPLFVTDKIVFFSPSLIYYGMAYSKIIYVLRQDEKCKQAVSQMARDREKIMTDDLCDFIEKHSDLLFIPNYSIYENNKPKAEFDLILYDEEHKKMLLCELKWFFTGDGEYEVAKEERKLQDAIANRWKSEKTAKAHLDEIKKELGIEGDDGIEIKSCIISKNATGSDFLQDDLPVLDVFWFKTLLQNVSFDFGELFKMFDERVYLPDMSEIGVKFITIEAEFAGYKIKMERIDNGVFEQLEQFEQLFKKFK